MDPKGALPDSSTEKEKDPLFFIKRMLANGDDELTIEEKVAMVQEQKAEAAQLRANSRALKIRKKKAAGEAASKDVGVIAPAANSDDEDGPPEEISHEEAVAQKTKLELAIAVLKPVANGAGENDEHKPAANPPLPGLGVAAHLGAGSDSDDDPPEELSNEDAIAQEMYLQYLENLPAPVNPFPLIRSLETFDDWNHEDRERYYQHLCYEERHRRYLKQSELDYIHTYCLHNPQGRHSRFAD